jgi:hypothetical protein
MTMRSSVRGPLTAALFSWLCGLAVLVSSSGAFAQEQKVIELNRSAMEDYQNLEMDGAIAKLERALEVAKKSGVGGGTLAQTYVNLGVVYVGGRGDNASGLEAFEKAILESSSARLDPLTSTPEIQTVWNLAKKKSRGATTSVPGNIPHVAAEGQQTGTPLPVFVDAPADAPVDRISIFYRTAGTRDFAKERMERLEGGFGFEIPCAVVVPPGVEYYFVAYDKKGKAIGFAGKSDAPVSVPVVSSIVGPPPSLPGREPPARCVDAECPPGMPGCTSEPEPGTSNVGASCESDEDCSPGLECADDLCVMLSGGEDEGASEGGEAPRFFAHLGGTFGAAYVTEGMPADSAPSGTGTSTTHIPATDPGCKLDNADEYCVRIQTPGFVPTFALRVTAGYYVFERLAAALTWRFQPNSGQGALSSMLLGLRVQYLITDPAAEGLALTAHLGTSYGQIQPQPSQPTSDKAPFVRSGLNGFQGGGGIVYRFSKNFGLFFTPEVHVLLPLFLFNIDLTAGLEVGF